MQVEQEQQDQKNTTSGDAKNDIIQIVSQTKETQNATSFKNVTAAIQVNVTSNATANVSSNITANQTANATQKANITANVTANTTQNATMAV